MNLPSFDPSTILLLSYVMTILLGARGLTRHLRDGARGEGNAPAAFHPTREVAL